MALKIGFAEIHFEPFLNENFDLDPAKKIILTPYEFDTADEVTSTVSKDTTTLVRGDGSKDVYENPNPESGVMTLTVLNPVKDKLQDILFPDSIVTINGTKEKREIFDSPGAIHSTWQRECKVTIKPLDESKNPVTPNDWLIFPRAIVKPSIKDSFAQNPSKTELSIISLGGRNPGSEAVAVGNISLAAPIDLSTPAGGKGINITIDGTLYQDVSLGQSATATGAEIINAINNAIGTIVATIDVNNFLNISGFAPGGSVMIDDPSVGLSAFGLVFGVAPITAPALFTGVPASYIPVQIRGDETA